MAIQNSDLDCQKCGEGEKLLRGCEKEVSPYCSYGESYTRCPVKLITRETMIYIKIYNAIKTMKQLYNTGGIGDQSAKLVEIFNIIDSEISRYNHRKIK